MHPSVAVSRTGNYSALIVQDERTCIRVSRGVGGRLELVEHYPNYRPQVTDTYGELARS